MSGVQPVSSSPQWFSRFRSAARRLLYSVAFSFLFGCGFAGLWLYLNQHYIRGYLVAWQAQQRVESVYTLVRNTVLEGAMTVQMEQPKSGIYALSLSDDAEQLAFVRTQQTLIVSMPYADVEAHYKAVLTRGGWKAQGVTSSAGRITMVFKPFDDPHLMAGLCHLPDDLFAAAKTTYRVFIDFDEGVPCANHNNRLDCVAARYCRS
jgi:hypothetical protein